MNKEIILLKNNDKKDLSDLEWIKEFYDFLQGDIPNGISLARGVSLKLNDKQAFSIIWYLQEHFCVLPCHIEKCSECGSLYDSWSSGYHSELKSKYFCDGCFPPFLDEREDKIMQRRFKKEQVKKIKI